MGIDISALIGTALIDFSAEQANGKITPSYGSGGSSVGGTSGISFSADLAAAMDRVHIGDMARSLLLHGKDGTAYAGRIASLEGARTATSTSVSGGASSESLRSRSFCHSWCE